MKTVSEKLTELYASKWNKLTEQLQANGLKTQCPHVLSIERNKEEDWYTKADIKIMFFGQEANNWEHDEDLGDTMRKYEEFFENKYEVTENSGYFKHEEINAGNHFMRWGCNGIMSAFPEILKPYPHKRATLLWNNISKLSTLEGGPVNAQTHTIEREYFHVIPQEIEILQPDILIFLTGPGKNKYYDYILENFEFDGEPTPLSNLPIDDVTKLPIKGVKLAYKTYHPNSRHTEEFHWKHYQAIIDDIKENIEQLVSNK